MQQMERGKPLKLATQILVGAWKTVEKGMERTFSDCLNTVDR